MGKDSKRIVDRKAQLEKFKEAARELETDDSDEKFDLIVKKIATSAPAKKTKEN